MCMCMCILHECTFEGNDEISRNRLGTLKRSSSIFQAKKSQDSFAFQEFSKSLPSLPRQHSATIGCTKNYPPIGVTVHSRCVDSFEGLLQ